MKFSIIASAAVAAILSSTGVNAQCHPSPCNPCPGGITADPNTETIPGRTCGNVNNDACQVPDASNVCAQITADAIEKCCPTVDAPEFSACSVCSGGLTVPENTEIPNTGGITCGRMMDDAKETEEGGNRCNQMKNSEGTCCPETPAAEEPTTCSVCPNGIPMENIDLPTVAGKTCKDLLVDAPKQLEGNNVCNAMKNSEDVCCPFVATATPTAVPTTVEVITTIAATVPDVADVITPSPTAPVPTAPPTNKPTIGPTSRDQIFGNILQTSPDNDGNNDENSPTPAPSKASVPTYSPTTESPTYSPTYWDKDMAGNGKPPPGTGGPGNQFTLPGDAQSVSAGVSVATRLGFVVTLIFGACGILLL